MDVSNDKVAATHHPETIHGPIRVKHVSIDKDGLGTIEVTPPTDHLDPAHAPVPHAHMDEH
jgi:hypothetical protein